MNIYWCYDRYEYYGVYISAPTRNKARELATWHLSSEYIDINAKCYAKNVDIEIGVTIDCSDLTSLLKYGLSMSCENCDYQGECTYDARFYFTEDNKNDL